MDAIVVGGGIVGLASATELAGRGVDVTLLERDELGAGSTDRAVGGIRASFSTRVNVDCSLYSLDVWESFEERFGVDVAFRQHGYLFLAREAATAERFEETAAMARERGAPVEYVDADTAADHCGGIDADLFVGGTYCPRDGYADPHLALQGYSQAAADAGVDVRTDAPVESLLTDGERVVGVESDGEELHADRVVLATGAWTRPLAATAGVDLPIAPRRRQVATVEPERPVPETDPLTIDLDTGSYFRPERDGRAIVGGHFADADPDVDPDGYPSGPDVPWAADAIERAGEWTDYFGPESRLAGGWAGLYAVTPDDHAVVDEVRPGLVVAAGFSGHGFQHAPATGRIVSDLVVDGATDVTDIAALSADRFGDGERAERNVV
jgi:sarcosine oxidase subunit beta